MKKESFGTDTLKEIEIVNCPEFIKQMDMHKYSMHNKKIIVLNIECLAKYLAVNNDVVYITTSKDKADNFKYYGNCFSIFLPGKIDKLNNIMKHLDMRIDLHSFDFVIGNPPYDGELYLTIAEQVRHYLKEDGVEIILGPTQCLDNPYKTTYINNHKDLFNHLLEVEHVDKKIYECFDSFKGYSNLGKFIIKKNKSYINIDELWKKTRSEDEASLIEKIMNSSVKKISEVTTNNTKHGFCIPVGAIGGGKHYLVYDTVYCLAGGKALVESTKQKRKGHKGITTAKWIDFLEYDGKNPLNTNTTYIRVKDLQQAEIFYNAYRNFDVLRGLTTLARFGGGNIMHEFIPYYENPISEEEIIKDLRLNETDMKILKEYAKSDSYIWVTFPK